MIAMDLRPGDVIDAFGEQLRVLCSVADPLSSASASTSNWYLCAYAEGFPTRNIVCAPQLDFPVVS